MKDEESYDNAVTALLSTLHQATTPSAIKAAAARRRNTLHDMHTYLHRLGLDLNGDANSPDGGNDNRHYVPPLIFHVTGAKGKGSTLSLCESILRNAYGLNTGMFTSPHLVSIRERIRVNGVPVSRKVFGQIYWTVRRRLEKFQDDDDQTMAPKNDMEGDLPPLPKLPGYFRMLTLMALYTFCHYNPKIDVILLEVGMGGRYDATNVFEPHHPSHERQLVRGVTLIDYDHTRVLGSSLTQIAWEKGGIFVLDKLGNISMKDGGYNKFLEDYATTANNEQSEQQIINNEECDAAKSSSMMVFASGQNTPEVLGVLDKIANVNNGCHLQVVRNLPLESFPEIGLQGDHQRNNAALALAMCNHYSMERSSQHKPLQDELQHALAQTFWPGRCHTVSLSHPTSANATDYYEHELSMNIRCDGAHTPKSINACIDWFRKVSTLPSSACAFKKCHRVLLFNCSHERNPLPLLFSLYHSNLFDSVYFCKADFERPSAVPKRLDDKWIKELLPKSERVNDGGVVVTLESMCVELENLNRPSTGGSDGIRSCLDPLKLSASTWQDTLANVWKVLDMHSRHHVGGQPLPHPSMKVTTGLNVKDALSEIQMEVIPTTNNDDVGGERRVLTEVCVTGSLYIVGSALQAAGWEEGEASGNLV